MRSKDMIPPILFPFTADELEVLQVKQKYFITNCDIYINYNYQKIHYDLLKNYIGSNIVEYCHEEITNAKNYAGLLDIINNSVYTNFFKYFLCLAFREDKNLSVKKFKKWAGKKRLFLVRIFRNPTFIYEINRIYNTIVIPRIPQYDVRDNIFNRLYGLIPNFYDAEKIFHKSIECLTEGGRMFIIDRDSRNMFKNDKLKRIAEDCFERKIKQREEKRPGRVGWL